MPKRKQNMPRRTRRQPSLNPADDEENCAKPHDTEEFQSNANENAKISITNVKDTTMTEKLPPYENKEVSQRNMVNSKEDSHTENGSLGHSKSLEKKSHESEIESHTKHLRQLGNPPENFNVLTRNLKRPLDNVMGPVDYSKRPTGFVNFRNESEDGNMPVILNVFTLCKVSASNSKQKTTSIPGENSFPVTPPSSPPLLKLEKVSTQFPSSNGSTKLALNERRMESNVSFTPVKYLPHNGSNMVHPAVFPSGINRFVDERNYTVQNHVDQSSGKLAPHRFFVPPENEQFRRLSNGIRHGFLEGNRSYQCELRQLLRRNNMRQNERSNMNHELNNIGHSKLNSLPASAMSNAIHSSNLEPEFRQENGQTSSTKSQFASDHKNSVNNSDVFLSPRDAKVLQLKRKLKEQEEALKKLRTNH